MPPSFPHLSTYSVHTTCSHFYFSPLWLSANDFLAASHISSSHHPLLLCSSFLPYVPSLSLSPCLWLECHLMKPGLRAVEYRHHAAVHSGEDVREADGASPHENTCCTFHPSDDKRKTELLPNLKENHHHSFPPLLVYVGGRESAA